MINNKDLVDLIEHDLKGAMESQQDQINKIAEWIDAYEGEPYGNEDPNRSQIVWKLIKKQGESLISNLSKQFLGQHEIVEIEPLTYKDFIKSPIYEKLINHYWSKDLNNNKFIKALTRLAVKEGTAFVRVGWERKIDETSQIVSSLPDAVRQKFESKGAIIEDLEDGRIKIINRKVIANKPTADIVRNEDVYFDTTADKFEDIEFLIYEYTASIDDLKSQPELYDEESVNKLERILHSQNDLKMYAQEESHQYNRYAFTFEDDVRKKVRLYEYWGNYDIDDNGKAVPIVAVMARYGEDKVLLRMEKNPYPFNKIPFVCFPLIEDDFNVWGRALADLIEDEQKFSTSIVRSIIDNMAQSNNGIKFVKKGSIDPINFQRLMNQEPVVEIDTNENLSTVVQDGNFNPLPASVFNMLGIIDQQAESLTGISKMMQGIPGTEMKAASSNFSAVMTQSQIRLLDMTMNITNGLRQMFYMWLSMAVEYLDDDEIYQITGIYIPELKVKETKKLMMEYQLEELPEDTQQKVMMLIIKEIDDIFDLKDFKYDIKMKVGTDGLKDIKINQINMLMQQAGPLIQGGVVPSDILRELFADMTEAMDRPDIAKKVRGYQPQPDPMQQAMTQAQIAEVQAKAEKDKALAQNALARTQSEQAEAAEKLKGYKADQAVKLANAKKLSMDAEANYDAKQADAFAKIKGLDKSKESK